MMGDDADNETLLELKVMVSGALASSGALAKLKAEMRAAVFQSLQGGGQIPALENPRIQKFSRSLKGLQCTEILVEFLDFFGLGFTKQVFLAEAQMESAKLRAREALEAKLELPHAPEEPLLSTLITQVEAAEGQEAMTSPLAAKSPRHVAEISEARSAFDRYDVDNSGTIEKGELRSLLRDLFPHFSGPMLERYVTDEFRDADKDLSSTIDFEEFLVFYRRLVLSGKAQGSKKVDAILPLQFRPGGSDSPRGSGLLDLPPASKSEESDRPPPSRGEQPEPAAAAAPPEADETDDAEKLRKIEERLKELEGQHGDLFRPGSVDGNGDAAYDEDFEDPTEVSEVLDEDIEDEIESRLDTSDFEISEEPGMSDYDYFEDVGT